MNNLKNSAQLIGRLGNDPETKNFESGKVMATFSMATNETYNNNKGEVVEDTQWHTIVMWGKTAENAAKILEKGSEAVVKGKIVNRSYEKDGEKRYVTEIVASEFLAVGGKKEA